jgi:proteic killer suppression protein
LPEQQKMTLSSEGHAISPGREPFSLRITTLDNNNAERYYPVMIKGFASKDTETIFLRLFSTRLPPSLQRIALRKLLLIDAAERLEDLRIPPMNRLEKLTGDRQGKHSIRINDQWRICFRWADGDAYEVEIADYH